MPTQEQKDKIIDIIRKDNLITDCLVEYGYTRYSKPCENPGHCAIGALLFAAGYTNAQLAEMADDPSEFSTDVVITLREEYGLTELQSEWIVGANDQYIRYPDDMNVDDLQEYYLNRRRENVIEVVNKM
jgi:hypothetical protein